MNYRASGHGATGMAATAHAATSREPEREMSAGFGGRSDVYNVFNVQRHSHVNRKFAGQMSIPAWIERKRCADPGDLKRFIRRSRCRNG